MNKQRPTPRVNVRGIIIDNNEILGFKHRPEQNYFALPGGGVDPFESLHDAIVREMVEETTISPKVGQIRFIQELILQQDKNPQHLIEFFYLIENGADFRKIDLSAASHGFEVAEMKWISLDSAEEFLPKFVRPSLQKSIKSDAPEFFSLR